MALISILRRIFFWLPEYIYLKILFYLETGYHLDLKNPRTFNQKIQWLKLYNRHPDYSLMVDKYEAKRYIGNIIGNEYIIPLIDYWEKTEDIDWEKLPNQFVIKTTHGGGNSGVII